MLSFRFPQNPGAHAALATVSRGCSPPEGRLPTRYSPVRRSTRSPKGPFALDLHVLGTPPAFVLSQDQTLQFEPLTSTTSSELTSQVRAIQFSKSRHISPCIGNAARIFGSASRCLPVRRKASRRTRLRVTAGQTGPGSRRIVAECTLRVNHPRARIRGFLRAYSMVADCRCKSKMLPGDSGPKLIGIVGEDGRIDTIDVKDAPRRPTAWARICCNRTLETALAS